MRKLVEFTLEHKFYEKLSLLGDKEGCCNIEMHLNDSTSFYQTEDCKVFPHTPLPYGLGV